MRSTLLRASHSILIAAVLAHAAAIPLAAQDTTALQADARVRLMTVGADRWLDRKAAGAILGVATYEECTGFCIADPGQGGTGLIAGVLGGHSGSGSGR